MLSRIAESLFWMGRYTERAETTARVLDVYAHCLLEYRVGEDTIACERLLEALGADERAETIGTDVDELIRFVVDDPRYGGSIVGSLDAAWENARRARETISSEMWESINITHATLARRGPSSAFALRNLLGWARDRAAVFAGLSDTTMSHDDAWRFLVLGRSLERVDMTVRLLTTRLDEAWGNDGWVAMLRCCSAYESFLRTYRRGVNGRRALEFLLLDRLFPRSAFHALNVAEGVCFALDPEAGRRGFGNEPRRIIGSACAALEFGRTEDLESSLDDQLDQLERACTMACDAIAARYFHATHAIRWSA